MVIAQRPGQAVTAHANGDQSDKTKYKITVPMPPIPRGTTLPEVRGDASRPLVVIDAGHGGVDPGVINVNTGLREKDVTLQIAQAIRNELLAIGRFRVALTRDDDRHLILRERYGMARRLKASMFISVHCDSVASGDTSGASVYTLSEVASDKEAARLATRENKADLISGVNPGDADADVSSILIDLTQRKTMNASAQFARALGREAKPLIPTKTAFHRMASLIVLKAPDMPSILFETGYISNRSDAAFLGSRDGQSRIARSVRAAADQYFDSMPQRGKEREQTYWSSGSTTSNPVGPDVPFTRQATGIMLYGDASTWWNQAAGKYERGNVPRVGSAIAFAKTERLPVGHVAVVSRIVEKRVLILTHANWTGQNGARGHAEQDITLYDVSDRNDWSKVKVWYRDAEGLSDEIFAVSGFIYGRNPSPQLQSVNSDNVGALTDAYVPGDGK